MLLNWDGYSPAYIGHHAPHNGRVSERATVKRLIDEAARRHLRPLGLRQRGRSRLWFDDRGWSLITVEFQPGRGLGTCLNVAATWLWYDHGGVWTLDEGGRVWWRDDGQFTTEPDLGPPGQQWAQFTREHIFATEMDTVVGVAARCVRQFREPLSFREFRAYDGARRSAVTGRG